VAETIFRGENLGERCSRVAFKNDWRLVPKEEEEAILLRPHTPRPVNTVPRKSAFPPLFEYLLVKEKESNKQKTDGKLMMDTVIKQGRDNRAKYAD
jgi:hypothetical protein